MGLLGEGKVDIIEAFPPVDLQDGANTGDWVSMKNNKSITVLFGSGLGTAAQDPTITVQQASDNAGTGAKALNFTVIYRKQAATSLAAVGQWTRTTQTAANIYTNGTSAEEDLIWGVEIEASDLDVDNGFDHLRVTVADVGGNAQPGYALYLAEPVYARAPASVQSSL